MPDKYFIITIDTEADNQWESNTCTTNNSKFLGRFQELAEKYSYKPVWLTTYEMLQDNFFVSYFKEKQNAGNCEIGMHLHAWNNPPKYELLTKTNEKAYLIEYPINIMEKKICKLDNLISKKFGKKAISHRAGRWAMNNDYFHLLDKYGYKVDCSITPHVNWSKNLGATGINGIDYSNADESFSFMYNLLEVPVTIKKIRLFEKNEIRNFKCLLKQFFYYVKGRYQWVRPDKSFNFSRIKKVIDICSKKNEYIMFMIHSSELMPGGSPNFKNNDEIDKLYYLIEEIFKYTNKLGYKGITLREFYEYFK